MIVIDFEWNRSYDKIPLEEILQIGAVKLDRLGGPILDTCCLFIRPKVHKRLNRTAKTLPELRASLDSTLDFPTALNIFLDWCGEDRVFADWGGDDFEVLRQNCAYWHLPAPEPEKLVDLQAAFSLRVGTNQGVALHRAVEYCGIPAPFTYHNALNDAVYTALLTAWLDRDTMARLEIPKELRRLLDTPPFPPQPERSVGPYSSVASALGSRSARRQSCPLCGETVWVRQWSSPEEGRYYADLRCRTHGSYLSQLALQPGEGGQWLGQLSVPERTTALLTDYARALQRGVLPCKSRQAAKKHRRRGRSRTAQKAAAKNS